MSLESRKKWILPETVTTLDTFVNDLLAKRGIDSKESDTFLSPTLESIPIWRKLHGVKKAAKEIVEAIESDKRIYIHGDFDVDGVCATAIMWEFLYKDVAKKLGRKVDVLPYIPDRIDEGYGLSRSSIDSMLENGAQLIITVDCGVRDREIIQEYMDKTDCKFIVTDHHQPPDDIKDVKYTVVHQSFPTKEYPEEKVCGAFVSLLTTFGVRDKLGMDSTLDINTKGLDLVALATVADMMPLMGVNRAVVKYGLEQMREGTRVGLKSIIDISGVDYRQLDSYHLGFVVGPRINAAGRIGSAMDALRMLVTDSKSSANELAGRLHNLNVMRQEKTSEIFEASLTTISESDSLIFVQGEDWHEGIIGLVASKLIERFGKPVVVVTTVEDGKYKGSARSIEGFNITDAISKYSDYLEKYGGHAQAAGFTVKPNELENFRKKLLSYAQKNLSTNLLERTIDIDIVVDPVTTNEKLLEELDRFKPFGYGNPTPLFGLVGVKVIDKFVMKGGLHMRLKVEKDNEDTTVVMFNCTEDVDNIQVGDTIDIVGTVSLNEWNGYRSVQLYVKEWRR